jgi:DnaJ-class molecular chaperone
MAAPSVECVECCGEGYDLDTMYEEGTEQDCSTCGGDGTVPGGEYEVQVTVTEHHVVTVTATSEAEAEELAHDAYLDTDSAYSIDKRIESCVEVA